MKLFVAGAPCSGKTTLVRHLRAEHGINAVDMDDLILELNGGTWPDIPTKNAVVMPKAVEHVLAQDDVVLFDTYLVPAYTSRLRASGFGIAVLDVSEAELRRRDARRQATEGWTNIEWFDHNQARLQELRDSGIVDAVIHGEDSIETVAQAVLRIGAHFPAC